jgi:hypothetical protein
VRARHCAPALFCVLRSTRPVFRVMYNLTAYTAGSQQTAGSVSPVLRPSRVHVPVCGSQRASHLAASPPASLIRDGELKFGKQIEALPSGGEDGGLLR